MAKKSDPSPKPMPQYYKACKQSYANGTNKDGTVRYGVCMQQQGHGGSHG